MKQKYECSKCFKICDEKDLTEVQDSESYFSRKRKLCEECIQETNRQDKYYRTFYGHYRRLQGGLE